MQSLVSGLQVFVLFGVLVCHASSYSYSHPLPENCKNPELEYSTSKIATPIDENEGDLSEFYISFIPVFNTKSSEFVGSRDEYFTNFILQQAIELGMKLDSPGVDNLDLIQRKEFLLMFANYFSSIAQTFSGLRNYASPSYLQQRLLTQGRTMEESKLGLLSDFLLSAVHGHYSTEPNTHFPALSFSKEEWGLALSVTFEAFVDSLHVWVSPHAAVEMSKVVQAIQYAKDFPGYGTSWFFAGNKLIEAQISSNQEQIIKLLCRFSPQERTTFIVLANTAFDEIYLAQLNRFRKQLLQTKHQH